jgi:hypothetical protein
MVVEPPGHITTGGHSFVRPAVHTPIGYGGAAPTRETISATARSVFVEGHDVERQEHSVFGAPYC